MQKFAGTCSPEQLHTLQSIFDLIWMELREHNTGSYTGPSEPDELREQIARRILDRYHGDGTSSGEITRQVLASFGIERPRPPAPVKANSDGREHSEAQAQRWDTSVNPVHR
jgi:hypothetical protein